MGPDRWDIGLHRDPPIQPFLFSLLKVCSLQFCFAPAHLTGHSRNGHQVNKYQNIKTPLSDSDSTPPAPISRSLECRKELGAR